MPRKLFCEISPLTYKLSVQKEVLRRRIHNKISAEIFANELSAEALPILVYKHESLIRRKLGNTDLSLQDNKAANLALAAPKVNGILIHPGETFSFWFLVGSCSKRKGYREGLTIVSHAPSQGIGGGMCQFTNLLHWLSLHSPLTITEHHHHDSIDLFPDFGRQVPFGCGTSILYNYLDYRLKNNTDQSFQFLVHTSATHLCGELRCSQALEQSYHIEETDSYFFSLGENYYRHNKIYRVTVDKRTGKRLQRSLIQENNARVMYDHALLDPSKIREGTRTSDFIQ